MPWSVRKRGDKYCVVKTDGGETVACHDSQESADVQRKALYANTDYGLQLAIQDFNLEDGVLAQKESDVNKPGGSHNLKNYWTRGPGAAKIRWGTDGSFDRCVRQLGKYVRNPQGLCAEYHKSATGEWPAEKGVESGGDMEEFHGNHNQRDHNPHKGFHIPDVGGDQSPPKPTSTRSLPDSDTDDKGPTRAENIRRMGELERKADSDAGLNESENRELRRLRKLYGDLYDPDWDDERERDDADGSIDDDFSLTAAAKTKEYETGEGDEPWSGVLTVEGVESGDSRLFALGSLDWERPPQPLMYQPANVGGHNSSVMVGSIKEITRHGSRIKGKGVVFGSALKGEHGEGIRHMMETGGVSVDVDKVKDADVEMVYADTEGGDANNLFAKPETTIFHRGRIRGATLVAFPAFVEAKLAFTGEMVTASGDCGCDENNPLVAAAHTITIPNLPKAEWFNEPTDVEMSGALTITDEGRVYGIVAPSDTLHRVKKKHVPRNVDFSRFHKGETIVEGGNRVVTGVITASCGHAATENYGTLQNRIEHYDNSCSVLANVRCGYRSDGAIWVAGALNAGAKPEQVAQALGCALSLDVQPHADKPGLKDFIAAHLVPVPGFPLGRAQASVQYEDGLITASSVPVEAAKMKKKKKVRYSVEFAAIDVAKYAMAESLGLDPTSRKQALMRQLEEVM